MSTNNGNRDVDGDETVYLSPGLALRARRQEASMLQAEIAEKLGITQSTYSKWEQRAIPPPKRQVARLAQLLRAHPQDLRTGRVPRRMVHPDWNTDVQGQFSQTRTDTPAAILHDATAGRSKQARRIADDIAYLGDNAPSLLHAAADIVRLIRRQAEMGTGVGAGGSDDD